MNQMEGRPILLQKKQQLAALKTQLQSFSKSNSVVGMTLTFLSVPIIAFGLSEFGLTFLAVGVVLWNVGYSLGLEKKKVTDKINAEMLHLILEIREIERR